MKIKTSKDDIVWSYLGYLLSYTTNLLIVLLVMRKLDTKLLGLWYTYLSIGALVQILDFGISATLVRNITYAWSGVPVITKEGFVSSSDSSEPNYKLLGEILFASKNICLIIAVTAMIIMCVLGTPYVLYVAREIDLNKYLLSWLLYVLAIFFNIYYIFWPNSLTGVGAIKQAQIATVISRLTQIIISIIMIKLNNGLLGLALAYLIMGFMLRVLSRKYFYEYHDIEKHIKLSGIENTFQKTKNIFIIIWHNARKAGIVSFSTFLFTQASTLICSAYVGLADTASYGLSTQLISALAAMSCIWFKAETPMLVNLKVKNNLEELKKHFSLCVFIYWSVFISGTLVISTVGVYLLKLIIKNSTAIPIKMLLFVAIVYCLEYNHSIFCGYIAMSNNIIYVKASIISGVIVLTLTLICGIFLGNVYSLIFSQFIVQLAYNNWKWPSIVLKELKLSPLEFILLGLNEFRKKIFYKIQRLSLMNSFKTILRKSKFLYKIIENLKKINNDVINLWLKVKILLYYKNNNDSEICQIRDFLKRNHLYLYNYDWYLEYLKMSFDANYDKISKLYYFYHKQRKVYYPDYGGGVCNIKHNFKLMLSEQDKRCPHCYGNYIQNSEYFDVIIDAGVAEGMFSINYLSQANRLILIEGDRNWCNTLRHTFAKEIKSGKVILINKFLSNCNNDKYITLDNIKSQYIGKINNLLIKMDIEGYEEKALVSGKQLFKETKSVKVIACSYHHQNAENAITMILKEYGMSTETSKGYIYLFPKYERTIFHEKNSEGIISLLRHALVIGRKNGI